MDDLRKKIDQAVRDGLVTRIAPDVSGKPPKPNKKKDAPVRWHPDTCDRGGRLWPAAHLDEEDEE